MLLKAFTVAFVLVFGAGMAVAAEDPGGKTVLVLDASGSMWGQIKGEAKITIAREVIAKLVKGLNPNTELGLSAYGHRRKGDCEDIEMLTPVSRLDPKSITEAINKLKPKGKTPLSEAVRRAAHHLKYQEEKASVILVSDGRETCNADPCALGRELEESGADFTVHVIGFDVSREERHGLQCLAENTGGVYLSADDAESLTAALGTAVKQSATGSLRSTVLIPVLVEGGERAHVGVNWTVFKALDEKGALGDEVYSTTSDVVVTPLPTGRYVVEAKYANALGRKVVDINAEDPGKHQVALNAGLLHLKALKKAGSDLYRGYPYLFWSIHPIGDDGEPAEKYLVKDDGNPKEFILAPGRYVVRAEAGVIAMETEVEIKAGETTDKTVVLNSGTVNLTALVKEGGLPYKGSPYLFWSIHPIGDDAKPAEKYLTKTDGNPKTFVLSPGRYVARAEAGVLKTEAEFEVKADETTEVTAVMASGTVNLVALVKEGGLPYKGSPYLFWSVHPIGEDGKPTEKYLTKKDRNPRTFVLPPGRYMARAEAGVVSAEADVEIKAGETTDKTVVLSSGTVDLTALEKEGGRLYKGSPYLFWSIYPIGADGKPTKKYLTKNDGNPGTFVLSPGRYVARAEAGVVEAEGEFEVKAGAPTKNTTVLNAGRVKAAFVDKAGGKPLKGLSVWYVHVVGADGKPAKKYLTYADRNPYVFFLPQGRYLARAKLDKVDIEGAFDVAPGDEKSVEFVAGNR
jgi:Ca-activated chloride channel homolog